MNLRLGLVCVFSTVVAAFPVSIAAQGTELEQALRSLVAAQTETKAAPKEVSEIPAEFHGDWGSEELCLNPELSPMTITANYVSGVGVYTSYEMTSGVVDGAVFSFSAPLVCYETMGPCEPQIHDLKLERKGERLLLEIDGELVDGELTDGKPYELPRCAENP